MAKLTAEMELAKRIYEAWGVGDEPQTVTKMMAVVAARVAMGRTADGKTDELWDALVSALDLDPAGISKNLRGRLNNAHAQLREMNATPAQVLAKAKAFRYHHADWELTEQSLVTHWARLRVGADGARPQQTIERELEPELVPPPPGFWEGVAAATKAMPE